MVGGDLLDSEILTRADGSQRLVNQRALSDHACPVGSARIVRVEVDRQAGRVEDEQVERGASLECPPGGREG